MTMYSYSQNRHADPADVSQNQENRLNDLHVRSARKQAENQLKGKGTDDCVDCESKIDVKRKEIVPSSTRCAPCQQDHDHLAELPGYGSQLS